MGDYGLASEAQSAFGLLDETQWKAGCSFLGNELSGHCPGPPGALKRP